MPSFPNPWRGLGGGVLWSAVAACGLVATLVIARVVSAAPVAEEVPVAAA